MIKLTQLQAPVYINPNHITAVWPCVRQAIASNITGCHVGIVGRAEDVWVKESASEVYKLISKTELLQNEK